MKTLKNTGVDVSEDDPEVNEILENDNDSDNVGVDENSGKMTMTQMKIWITRKVWMIWMTRKMTQITLKIWTQAKI